MLILTLLSAASAGVVRHALIVGSNDGGAEFDPLQYAASDAARVQQVLEELGGFAPENITVLSEPQRDELLAEMQKHARIAEEHDEDLFLFYYSGHATSRGLKLGEETLPYDELRGSMNELPSEVRVGVLDACRSGEITRLKGLKLSEPFATEGLQAEGEAWITASSEDEDAQESDRIQGSFFTHYLVSGLRGAADQGDGVVSLDEAYRYAYAQTVSQTGRTDAGTQHPAYRYQLQGEGDLPLTNVYEGSSKITIPEDIAGVITVISLPDETLLVEVAKKADVVNTIAVPPGQYRLRLKDSTGTREIPMLSLSEGATLKLPSRYFTAQPTELASAKGAGEMGISEEDIAFEQAPPPLFGPDDPLLAEEPVAAIVAAVGRVGEHIDYQSRELDGAIQGRERIRDWFEPGRSTAIPADAPPAAPPAYSEAMVVTSQAGVCEVVGAGCLSTVSAGEGLVTLTFADGTPAAQGTLVAGVPNGLWTFYHDNGAHHSTGYYSNGVTHGEWEYWYASGQKRMKGSLQGEARVGTWLEWYDNGRKKSRTQYENGATNGRQVTWYESGQKKSEGHMRGPVRDGDWTLFYEDGRKEARGSYRAGQRTGTWTTWNAEGGKASKGRYLNDLKHGKWTFWWEDGTVSSEGSYRRGSKEGRWETWHPNQLMRSKARYTDGLLDGRYTEWDDRGKRTAKGTYRGGERVGLWVTWDENGRTIERLSRRTATE